MRRDLETRRAIPAEAWVVQSPTRDLGADWLTEPQLKKRSVIFRKAYAR